MTLCLRLGKSEVLVGAGVLDHIFMRSFDDNKLNLKLSFSFEKSLCLMMSRTLMQKNMEVPDLDCGH